MLGREEREGKSEYKREEYEVEYKSMNKGIEKDKKTGE